MARRESREKWDAKSIRALREYLGWTQKALASELGTRQQTISEWETGVYQPRGASLTLLAWLAERVGFAPGAEATPAAPRRRAVVERASASSEEAPAEDWAPWATG